MSSASVEFIPFRFEIKLYSGDATSGTPICSGAFSEVTGFEFTMTPKSLQEGGRNWGEIQLAGNTKFAAITLKRGITNIRDLYEWFDVTSRQANYAFRITGLINVYDQAHIGAEGLTPLLRWKITRAIATKFKGPDLSATASQVAIEELQLMHEGLVLLKEGE